MKVTKKQFGDAWPFTVNSGKLCSPKPNAACFKSKGKIYALNGIAMAHGYADVDSIWRDDPRPGGIKIHLRPMVVIALELDKSQ